MKKAIRWITQKLAESKIRSEQRGSFELHYGDKILYRGKPYPIAAKPGNHAGFDGDRFWVPPGLPPEQIKGACIQVYRLLALQVMRGKNYGLCKTDECQTTRLHGGYFAIVAVESRV